MILDLVKKFRTFDQETPIVLMGYLNTFISHIDLVKSADSNSVDSILVVDVPGELNLETYGISNPNINTISLISPTTKEDRVESIAKNSTGFIYYVNLRGVTGSSNLNIDEIQKNIARIQQYTDLPTMAGFGIKSIEDAKTLAACSDGIVIGSSIVEMIDEESSTKEFGRISKYLREMKTAIS
jgi:tryptophan synthase alpha chain